MRLLSYFLPFAPLRLVYMLQQVEYDSFKFADWVDKMPNLAQVQTRQKLDLTARATLTLLVAYVLWGVPLLSGAFLFLVSTKMLWLLLIAFAPLFCVVGLFIFNGFFGSFVVKTSEQKQIAAAYKKLAKAKAVRIAVLGSYGKTTMKDILQTILGDAREVKATPGNKNVLISHARWVLEEVDGKEDVLIFEYGEAEPGDIAKLAEFSKPDTAVITGLAPAHMDGYGTLDAIGKDFRAINKIVDSKNLFVNSDSPELIYRVKEGVKYSHKAVDGWKISDISVSLDGLRFTMTKLKQKLHLTSGLLGVHNVGPLAVAVAIGARLRLSDEQLVAGVAKTRPFEHRLSPYELNGATIIDDTYNGNLEGLKAGLELLKSLPAKRKIYVTPGLVEQGSESQAIHEQLGKYIASCNPDRVVLMQNSTTKAIRRGLKVANFIGELEVETEPLNFYENIGHFVAGGDLVLLQNDWTDNYS